MALTCANCQTQLPDDAKFCAECGTQVAAPEEEEPEPPFCLHCGVRLPENVKFCLACGTRVTIDEKPLNEKIDKSVVEEIFKNPYPRDERYPGRPVILDFEEHRFEIQERVKRYVEYIAGFMSAPDWFNMLYSMSSDDGRYPFHYPFDAEWSFWTNKPNAQHALISKTLIEYYTFQAKLRDYIDSEGKFAPIVLAYINRVGDWSDDELQALRIPSSYPELEELAKKDDELFPPPQPIRVEVAGEVLNFTTDEAALVVYADCSHKGEKIEIEDCQNSTISMQLWDEERREAEIIERSVDNMVVCAAIFNHLPFVNDSFKRFQNVLHRVDFTIKPDVLAHFEDRREETITVFRGNVAEIDWRWRK